MLCPHELTQFKIDLSWLYKLDYVVQITTIGLISAWPGSNNPMCMYTSISHTRSQENKLSPLRSDIAFIVSEATLLPSVKLFQKCQMAGVPEPKANHVMAGMLWEGPQSIPLLYTAHFYILQGCRWSRTCRWDVGVIVNLLWEGPQSILLLYTAMCRCNSPFATLCWLLDGQVATSNW